MLTSTSDNVKSGTFHTKMMNEWTTLSNMTPKPWLVSHQVHLGNNLLYDQVNVMILGVRNAQELQKKRNVSFLC